MGNLDRIYFDEINDYHFGNLSPEDRLLFEVNLITNSELLQAYEEFKTTIGIIKTQNIQNLKNNLQLLDTELDKELLAPKKLLTGSAKYIVFAVACILLASVALFFFNQRSNYKPAAAFYKRDIGLPVVMGAGNNAMDNAMSDYKLNKYTESKNILTTLFAKKPTDTVAYYIAVNEYELGNYHNAITYFIKINDRSVFYEKAQYRLGLSYWQDNEIEYARQVFLKLKSPKSPFSAQAEIILKKLK